MATIDLITTFTAAQLNRARKIARAAGDGTVIAPEKMVRLFPNRPTLHTHTHIRDAWDAEGFDPDAVSEALWG